VLIHLLCATRTPTGIVRTGFRLLDETRCFAVFDCMRAVLVLSYLSQFHSVDPEVEREILSIIPSHVLPNMQRCIYQLIWSITPVRRLDKIVIIIFDCGTLIRQIMG